MKLLDDIVLSVSEVEEPVARTLRRCLVLAYKLKNETLKTWVEKELNGYENDDELPDYRQSVGNAKGVFLGPFGGVLSDQPLAASILEEKHRHFATTIRLNQPIAVYEMNDNDAGGAIPWPADLVVTYQSSFMKGWALNRAWMDIPASVTKGLIDTVRTRVLTFALQIQDELRDESEESIESIPPAVVERMVNVTILGGNNVFGDVQEFNAPTVVAGDIQSLKAALESLGVTEGEFAELEASLQQGSTYPVEDRTDQTLSKRTAEWISTTAKKLGSAGVKIGGKVVEEAVKRLVMDYLGMTP